MKRRILMLFLLVSACSCAFLSMNSVSFFLPQRFAAAQSQWQASGIRDYEVIVGVATFSELSQYRIVVRDGNIVEAGQRPTLLSLAVEDPPYNPSTFTSISLSQAESYTLDALMNRASETVGSASTIEIHSSCNPHWDAEYDSQYGYVQSLRMSCGGGFLGCAIGDCFDNYTVLKFTPLP